MSRTIHEARLSKKLSLRDVAKKTGLSYQFIWDIETGRRIPSFKNMQNILTVLDIEFYFSPKLNK
ncbi:MAG: helix-turn-helix domain-containing protein [Clostridiales bacterium]|nr:helix-turn-helix domain-containing protein [Clostridiales bacterium]